MWEVQESPRFGFFYHKKIVDLQGVWYRAKQPPIAIHATNHETQPAFRFAEYQLCKNHIDKQ